MSAVLVLVNIFLALLAIVLIVAVLMQEGNTQGLGSIGGMADSYWGKNKGRSMEGTLVWLTRVLAAAFIILSVVLNMSFWTK